MSNFTLTHKIRFYDEKLNAEFINQSIEANRKNYQRQINTRNHNSPMSIAGTGNDWKKKDNSFMAVLKLIRIFKKQFY